jgi:hypothetical protein
MLERLRDIELTEYGTVTEEIELICTMTGFRLRFLVPYLGPLLRRGVVPLFGARARIARETYIPSSFGE